MQEPRIYPKRVFSSAEQNKSVDGIVHNHSTDFPESCNPDNSFHCSEEETKAMKFATIRRFPSTLDSNSYISSEGYIQTAKRIKVMPLADVTNSAPVSTQYI